MPIYTRFRTGAIPSWKGLFADPPADPMEGWMYGDTDDDGIYYYTAGSWVLLGYWIVAVPGANEGIPMGLLLTLTYDA